MPTGIDRVDQLPLPSLQWYAGFSGLALFYAVVYALATPEGLFHTLRSDVWCEAAVLNMGCCCLFLLTNNFIYSFVFGSLQHMEQQHMRDKFWNFVFYKFIFVFGVMNVQEMQEMLCWCAWFAVLGTLLLTEQLCKDRFQFLSFSPNTPASSHAKIIILLVMVFLSCAGLFMVCAIVGWQYGFNHFTFLYSEVFILFARTMHTIIRYIIHLWDMHHDGPWENRSTYTYYAELILELAALCVDFMHHVHMLLWANMFLSVASLILLMKLRFLYQEIQRRLKRHRNYVLVSDTLENRFSLVTKDELMMSDETCAICWERMATARRLPCGHLFHMGCLRSWLEQDTVCPTCRRSLSDNLRHDAEGEEREEREGTLRRWRGRWRRNMWRNRNWLLHFNGASIASWLPMISLELHQEDDPRWIGNDPAELHRGAQQVHSMFPHIPLQAITLNLADTHSVSLTVEHILNETIYIPGQEGPPPLSPASSHSHPSLPSPPSLPTPASGVVQEPNSDSSDDASSDQETDDANGDDHSSGETPINSGTSEVPRVGVEVDGDHSMRMETGHSDGNSGCSNGGVTTGSLRHRNVDRTEMRTDMHSRMSVGGEPQASGVNATETSSGEIDVNPMHTSSDSGVSVQDPSIPSAPNPQTHDMAHKRTDRSSTAQLSSPRTTARKSSSNPGSSSLPVPTPSPYSFASLQQRKQKLLQSARRQYLMKHQSDASD